MKPLVILLSFTFFSTTLYANSHSQQHFDTGGLSRESFPEGFLFGTAASAYQVEGMASEDGRGPSIWDAFVKTPGHIANNETGEVSIDQYHRYKMLNFDAYRFSISWSRIFPNGIGEVNWKGVDYYNRLIDYLLEKGITPHANLYHYDLPLALQEKYLGLLDRQVIQDFADYAEFCFKTFGDRVKTWMTFNEPRVVAALGFDNGINPPNRCSKKFGNCTDGNSATEPYIAAHHLILMLKPLKDIRARDFHIGWFLHPLIYGKYPRTMQKIVRERLPKFTKSEVEKVKNSFDVLCLNHYTSYYIYEPHQPPSNVTGYQQDWNAGFAYERNGVPIGRRLKCLIYKKCRPIPNAVTYVKKHYGSPNIILSENGMDDPGNLTFPESLYDINRVSFYRSYLKELKRAMDDGANVTGYFAWSILDNFEWLLGYTSRFGLVYVDHNDLKRYPKLSAYWFKQMLERKNS
ncbi:hypothetical protein ES332_D01G264300v1 [Gossypium tomentosum]|uniref:Beta-glucosidase n=1 Tax=Gossypium tomentosum TaxID=34277 RepID=A0A5D2MDW5_GOSTO|nr:hypothetical protein ES332_D01G264300v1 [Gossypium tomentosum]